MATCPVNSPDTPEPVCPASFHTVSALSWSGKLCSHAGQSQRCGRVCKTGVQRLLTALSPLPGPWRGGGGELGQGRLFFFFAEKQAGRGGERVTGMLTLPSSASSPPGPPPAPKLCTPVPEASGLQSLSEPLSPPHPCPSSRPSLISQRDPPSISSTPPH